MELILIGFAALLASGLTLLSGFGQGTALMPVFALFFPLQLAIAATAVVHFANNLFKLGLMAQQTDWSVVVKFSLPAQREEIRHREFVEHIIDFLEIQAYRKTPVGQLPYGLQKRVDLGRALAMQPQVLLLDEPMAGMNVEEKQDMCRFILDVNDEFGSTIVLIEHDMGVVMDISDRVVVLDYGKKIGDGAPDEVRQNEDVIRAYLGTGH